MDQEFPIKVKPETLSEILKKKNEMGFNKKTWEEWFDEIFKPKQRKISNIIEDAFQEKNFEKWYDVWIKNFSLNLEYIWNGNSVKELSKKNDLGEKKSSIVIGRGPTIIEHKHLEKLANSDYNGNIVCCDGALKTVLNSGVTPEKFRNFYVVSIDAQDSIKNFYDDPIVNKYGNDINAIFSTTISPETRDIALKSGIKIFWVHALFDYNKGKSSFNYISSIMTKVKNENLGLPAIQTGGNVGTSSWIISWSILKSSPVVLLGIDHGYPVDTQWEQINSYHKLPEDIDKNSEIFKKAYPTIYNPDFETYCIQDPVFQYYSNALKEFIPKSPEWVKTINATEGGAIFGEKIIPMKFSNFLDSEQKLSKTN